jgi:hypothetical protein
MAIKHKKNLAGASNGNPNQVQPGDWNDPHDLTGLLALLDTETVTPDRVLALGSDGLIQFLSKSTWLLALNAVLTGTPTAPTALAGTNTQQIATTAFVQAAINALIDAAPGALNTLDELAAALGDDANFAATITAALAAKAPLASPALTGNPTAPNQSALTNNTRIANTAYADAAVAALSALIVAGTTAVPGSIVGSSLTILSSFFTSSVAVPVDDTSPTNTEGDQILTTSFTPKSTTNKLRCTFRGTCSASGARNAIASIFAGSANIGAQCVTIAAADHKAVWHIVCEYTPGAITAQTISVRMGGAEGAVSVNGASAARLLGGSQVCSLLIEEIKA